MFSHFFKAALTTTVLFISTVATAANIECSRDDEADDWAITGELGGAQIELFDNDHWSKFNMKHVLESLPPKYVYAEKGEPSNMIEVSPSHDGNEATAVYYEKGKYNEGIAFTCAVD